MKSTARKSTNLHFVHLRKKLLMNILLPNRHPIKNALPDHVYLVYCLDSLFLTSVPLEAVLYRKRLFDMFHRQHQGTGPLQPLSVYCTESDIPYVQTYLCAGTNYTQEPRVLLQHSQTSICIMSS